MPPVWLSFISLKVVFIFFQKILLFFFFLDWRVSGVGALGNQNYIEERKWSLLTVVKSIQSLVCLPHLESKRGVVLGKRLYHYLYWHTLSIIMLITQLHKFLFDSSTNDDMITLIEKEK